jgi:hypothetical protein
LLVSHINKGETCERKNDGRNSGNVAYQAEQSYHATEPLLIDTNKATCKVILDDLEEATNRTKSVDYFSSSVVQSAASSDMKHKTFLGPGSSKSPHSKNNSPVKEEKEPSLSMFDDVTEIEESDESTSRKYFTYKRRSKTIERAVQEPCPVDTSFDEIEI